MADLSADNLKTVVLNDRHVALGGRMVPFAGYSLPVQYPTGIIAEHKWTREHASLFDVSHMGPAMVRGMVLRARPELTFEMLARGLETLVSGDIAGLRDGQLRYTLLLDESGGIRDDLIVGRTDNDLYVVVNAGTKDADYGLIQGALDGPRHPLKDAGFEGYGRIGQVARLDADHALLALQGPEASAVLSQLVPQVSRLGFMSFEGFGWGPTIVSISRSGYTGEDGFEILVPAQQAGALWDALVADQRVKPAGLGARDSLRLEAGLPLYGHDLNETVSPVEAGLNFALGKRRRQAGDIPGAARIAGELAGSLKRIRVGLMVDGAPAREGAEIVDASGTAVGVVTSGGFSPTLNRAIALGFVPPALAAAGTLLSVVVRGRSQPAVVTALPFVPHRYHRKPA